MSAPSSASEARAVTSASSGHFGTSEAPGDSGGSAAFEGAAAETARPGGPTVTAPVIVLYVFSGPHLGAEIELGPGRFLLGSGDSCDIILSGSSLAPRHAALSVERAPSGPPEVRVLPLDGSVRLDGENPLEGGGQGAAEGPRDGVSGGAPAELRPGAGSPWYLGLTCLAWGRPGVPVAAPSPRLESRASSAPASAGADSVAVKTDGEPVDANNVVGGGPAAGTTPAHEVGDPGENGGGIDELDALPTPEAPRKSGRGGRVFLLALALALLGAMSVAVAPPTISPDQYPGILEKKLEKAGLSGLSVQRFAQGVELRGTVEDEAALTVVRNLARDLHFPVYLDVAVRDDMLRAVNAAFRARGFYPAVSLLSGASPAAGQAGVPTPADEGVGPLGTEEDAEAPDARVALLVAGYMRDRLLEEGVFASLADDVAGLPPVRRHIVHRAEVAAALEPALAEAGLDFARVTYLPGTVEVAGPFGAEALDKARKALDQAGRELGVPLQSLIRVATLSPEPAPPDQKDDLGDAFRAAVDALAGMGGERTQTETGGQTSVAAAPGPNLAGERGASAPASSLASEGDPLGGLRVAGVTMSPLRFVTTSDGQRLFEGAVLPGGFTLDEISTMALKFRKDGRVVTYRLRGAS